MTYTRQIIIHPILECGVVLHAFGCYSKIICENVQKELL